MTAPLEGIRVLDMTSVVVGPLATQTMADYGADVIKIEAPPTGDLVRNMAGKARTANMSGKFLHLNRNKRSLVLDLKQPVAYEAFTRLLKTADVLIWNVRPSAMSRLKLSYEEVKAINPKIVYCGMFGFGQDGPYRSKPAYDTIIQGAAGIAALHHMATGEPRYVPIVMADRTVGLITVQMIMMALFHRQRTGEGAAIEIPMFENMVNYVLTEHLVLKTFEPPLGEMGDPRLVDPSSKPLKTKDGYISISPNTNAQVFALFDAIGRPELKTDPRFSSVPARFQNTREYFAIRAQHMADKTTAEWIEIFDRCDIPAMPYNTLEDLLVDPHLKEIGFFEMKDHPTEGKIRNMRLPNKLSIGARKDYQPAPKLGQQSVDLLREVGLSDAEIEQMVATKATIDGRLDRQ